MVEIVCQGIEDLGKREVGQFAMDIFSVHPQEIIRSDIRDGNSRSSNDRAVPTGRFLNNNLTLHWLEYTALI